MTCDIGKRQITSTNTKSCTTQPDRLFLVIKKSTLIPARWHFQLIFSKTPCGTAAITTISADFFFIVFGLNIRLRFDFLVTVVHYWQRLPIMSHDDRAPQYVLLC